MRRSFYELRAMIFRRTARQLHFEADGGGVVHMAIVEDANVHLALAGGRADGLKAKRQVFGSAEGWNQDNVHVRRPPFGAILPQLFPSERSTAPRNAAARVPCRTSASGCCPIVFRRDRLRAASG